MVMLYITLMGQIFGNFYTYVCLTRVSDTEESVKIAVNLFLKMPLARISYMV